MPKVLQKIGDKPMIYYPLQTLNLIGIKNIIVATSYKYEQVQSEVLKYYNVCYDRQARPLGTGHAVKCALKQIKEECKLVLILNGDDSAFYKKETLTEFIRSHAKFKATVSVITLILKTDNAFGKIIRDKNEKFKSLLESDKYPKSGEKSFEINCGTYIFDLKWLKKAFLGAKIGQGLNITTFINLASESGKVNLFKLEDKREWIGINTPDDLKYANWVKSYN